MFFKKYRGSSLVEVMISVGVLGIMSLVVMHIGGQSSKTVIKLELATDIDVSVNEINGLLADPDKCKATFSATTEPNSIVSRIEEDVVTGRKYSTAGTSGYGQSRFLVQSYKLSGEPPNAVLTINYKKPTVQDASGEASKTIDLYIKGDLTGDTPVIDTCRSVGAVDIWTRGEGNIIYYSGGNVGINTEAPFTRLNLSGNITVSKPGEMYAGLYTYSAGVDPTTTYNIDENEYKNPSNKITYSSTAVYATPSDKRLKKNIEPINNPLEKILSLRGVTFDWRNNDQHDVGFIAQEVQEQIPEIVENNSTGELLTVDYSKIVPLLVEAVKIQQAEINDIKNEINNLQ